MAIRFPSFMARDKVTPRRRQVYDGMTKTVFEGSEPLTQVLFFKDCTQLPSQTTTIITGKGAINNRLSEMFMSRLQDIGIPAHFIKRLNMSEQLIRETEELPFHVIVHNVAVDEFALRLGLEENTPLPRSVIEFHVNQPEAGDTVISDQHVEALEWASGGELDTIMDVCRRVNDFLSGQFLALGLRLLNIKLSFGRLYCDNLYEDERLVLIDEISPDTCALLDLNTLQRLDHSMIGVIGPDQASTLYQDIAKRFGLLDAGGPIDLR